MDNMHHILSVTRVGGRKYVVARGSKYDFIRINDAQGVESVSGIGPTGLYYDEVAALIPLGRDVRILVLGLGGGTVARRYRELGGQGDIFGVDNDPEMVRLGLEFFRLGEWNVKIICPMSAQRFIREAQSVGLKYDVVFDDLYVDGRDRVGVDARSLVALGGLYVRNDGHGKIHIETIGGGK